MKRGFQRSSAESWSKRRSVRIGIPRVLNLYSTAPWFRTYFEALGIAKQNVVFSGPTSEEMWVRGGKYGSIDPCFPSKVTQAHIHELLTVEHAPEKNKPLRYVFFPVLTHVPSFVEDTVDDAACPIVAGAPEVMKAAFTKEKDFFAERGIEYLCPALSMIEPTLLARRMAAGRGGGRQRQLGPEHRALAHRTRQPDLTAHQRGQLPADGQPQAGAAEAPRGGFVRLREGLEQPRLLLGRNAGAGVAHFQPHPAAGTAMAVALQRLHAQFHAATLGDGPRPWIHDRTYCRSQQRRTDWRWRSSP